MKLYKFENAHDFLDDLGFPRLSNYSNNVIIEKLDFEEHENNKNIEWREDGVFLKIQGKYRRGFMFNKDYKISEYGFPKFHLFECSIIEQFISKGILSRYYFWSNSGTVTVTQRGSKKEFNGVCLELCSKCSDILLTKNIDNISSTNDFGNILNRNDKKVEQNNDEKITDIFKRPINWESISKAYRLEQNYTCEDCGFGGNDLENVFDKRYIHCHHIDSFDLTNTHRSNLKAVCVLCHYNQDEYHLSQFDKPRLKGPLNSFIAKYKSKLLEIENPHIENYLKIK